MINDRRWGKIDEGVLSSHLEEGRKRERGNDNSLIKRMSSQNSLFVTCSSLIVTIVTVSSIVLVVVVIAAAAVCFL